VDGPELFVVLGGATILMQSPRCMMINSTIVHFATDAVMLRRGWMIRYLPEIVLRNVPEPTIVSAGYAWADLSVVHLRRFGWRKLAAFALQYGIFRVIVRRRIALSAM